MATWVNLMSVIYPVGSVYLSTNSTSPSSTIGGTWTSLTGGKYLRAAGAWGSGGSNVITIDQMPSHAHQLPFVSNWTPGLEGRIAMTSNDATEDDITWGGNAHSTGGGNPSIQHIKTHIVGIVLPKFSGVGDINAYSC